VTSQIDVQAADQVEDVSPLHAMNNPHRHRHGQQPFQTPGTTAEYYGFSIDSGPARDKSAGIREQ